MVYEENKADDLIDASAFKEEESKKNKLLNKEKPVRKKKQISNDTKQVESKETPKTSLQNERQTDIGKSQHIATPEKEVSSANNEPVIKEKAITKTVLVYDTIQVIDTVMVIDTIQRVSPTDNVHEENKEWRFDYQARLIFMSQIYHGIAHRTDITTFLNRQGVALPELDVWGYQEAYPDRFQAKLRKVSDD